MAARLTCTPGPVAAPKGGLIIGCPYMTGCWGIMGTPAPAGGCKPTPSQQRSGGGKESSVAQETHHPKCCSWLWDGWSTSCSRNSTCWRHSSSLKNKKIKLKKKQKKSKNLAPTIWKPHRVSSILKAVLESRTVMQHICSLKTKMLQRMRELNESLCTACFFIGKQG